MENSDKTTLAEVDAKESETKENTAKEVDKKATAEVSEKEDTQKVADADTKVTHQGYVAP